MARKLVVEIVGDASSLERTFRQSANGAKKFDQQMGKTFRGTIAGSGAFRGLGRSIAFASAGFLGGFGLTAAIRASFDEMAQAQKVTAQTNAAIQSTGAIAGVTAGHVEELGKSLLSLTGIDDEAIKGAENLLLTFTNIRNVVGKNNDIFDQATKAALDLSVRFDKDLGQSAVLVGKALQDPIKGVTALSRAGVQFSASQRKQIKALVESGKLLEAQKIILRELRTETGGAAAAFGRTLPGQISKFRESLKNLGGEIVGQLAPALTKLVDRANAWLSNVKNQRQVMNDAKAVMSAVASVLAALRDAFQELNAITGSTRTTLKLLIGAFIAFKALKIVSSLGLMAEGFAGAQAGATGLRGVLAGRGGLIIAVGALSFALTTAILKLTGADKKLQDFGGTAFDAIAKIRPFGLDIDPTKQFEGKDTPSQKTAKFLRAEAARMRAAGRTAQQAADELVRTHTNLAIHDAQVLAGVFEIQRPFKKAEDAVAAAFDATLKRVRQIAKKAGGADLPGEVQNRAAIAARARQAREAVRAEAVDRAQLAVDRTALTKSVADDIAALRKLNALLTRRIKGGHDVIGNERKQIQVQLQINDLLRQQADAAREAAKQAAEAAEARRDARQFRLLGFGPTGEDIVPGVKGLKRQLAAVNDALKGSFLDTRKTRGLIAHIRQVLSGSLGSVSSEVRAKIAAILADLRNQLKKSSVDVTRFNKTASGQFITQGAAGAGSGTIVVQGGIHLHGIHNMKELEDALAKRRKQRGHQRRSTR